MIATSTHFASNAGICHFPYPMWFVFWMFAFMQWAKTCPCFGCFSFNSLCQDRTRLGLKVTAKSTTPSGKGTATCAARAGLALQHHEAKWQDWGVCLDLLPSSCFCLPFLNLLELSQLCQFVCEVKSESAARVLYQRAALASRSQVLIIQRPNMGNSKPPQPKAQNKHLYPKVAGAGLHVEFETGLTSKLGTLVAEKNPECLLLGWDATSKWRNLGTLPEMAIFLSEHLGCFMRSAVPPGTYGAQNASGPWHLWDVNSLQSKWWNVLSTHILCRVKVQGHLHT